MAKVCSLVLNEVSNLEKKTVIMHRLIYERLTHIASENEAKGPPLLYERTGPREIRDLGDFGDAQLTCVYL